MINFFKKEKLLVAVLILTVAFFGAAYGSQKEESLNEGEINHKIIIEDLGEYDLILADGSTAGDALEKASVDNGFSVEYIEYDFGRMVQSINNKTANNDYFWGFYINDEMASVGADSLKIKEGDKTEWKYEEIKF